MARITDSGSRNAVSFSSACTTKCFPSPRRASAIQIVLCRVARLAPFIVAECLARPLLSERLVDELHAGSNPLAEAESLRSSMGRTEKESSDRAIGVRLLSSRDSNLTG